MMQFTKITDAKRLYDAIFVAFAGDNDLVERWHILGGTLEACVADTYNKIVHATSIMAMDWYEVWIDDTKVGYTVLSRSYNILYSFAINISFRGPAVQEEWFHKVGHLLRGEFFCTLWSKNERAIQFLVKHGMEIFSQDGEATQLRFS